MKHNRKISSSNHQSNKPSSSLDRSNNESQKLFEEQYIRQSLKSNTVEDFWHDIEVYTHEPGDKKELILFKNDFNY